MVAATLFLGILGLVLVATAGHRLLWLHRVRKLSDVTGTVVARDRQFTGKSHWTYPVVEYTARDGTPIRRTFHQLARPRIGRKLQIVYDPSAPDGRRRSTSTGLFLSSIEPLIYSVWMVQWLWLEIAVGLAFLAGGIAFAVAGGSTGAGIVTIEPSVVHNGGGIMPSDRVISGGEPRRSAGTATLLQVLGRGLRGPSQDLVAADIQAIDEGVRSGCPVCSALPMAATRSGSGKSSCT